MNIYTLSKKEINKIEKDFSSTVIGRKARLPILLSIMMTVVWAVVSLATIAMYFVSMCWSYMYCETWEVKYIASEPMSYLIAFLLVMILCFISMFNYNRELRAYISSLDTSVSGSQED